MLLRLLLATAVLLLAVPGALSHHNTVKEACDKCAETNGPRDQCKVSCCTGAPAGYCWTPAGSPDPTGSFLQCGASDAADPADTLNCISAPTSQTSSGGRKLRRFRFR